MCRLSYNIHVMESDLWEPEHNNVDLRLVPMAILLLHNFLGGSWHGMLHGMRLGRNHEEKKNFFFFERAQWGHHGKLRKTRCLGDIKKHIFLIDVLIFGMTSRRRQFKVKYSWISKLTHENTKLTEPYMCCLPPVYHI